MAGADVEALGRALPGGEIGVGDIEIELVLEELGFAAPLGAQSSPNARWSTGSKVRRMRHPVNVRLFWYSATASAAAAARAQDQPAISGAEGTAAGGNGR